MTDRFTDRQNNLKSLWRKKDVREEVGTKACIVGKIVKSRMKWAGHMVRMNDERSPKRSETKKQGFRKRGRPQLRWEDCGREISKVALQRSDN